MPDLPPLNLEVGAARPSGVPDLGIAARGAESFGRSASKAAKNLDQALFEAQDFKDRGAMAEMRLEMLKAEKEHAIFRQQNIDESTWQGDMDQRISAVQSRLGSLQLLPKNQQRAQQLFDEWSELSQLEVAESMQGQAIERSNLSFKNLLDVQEADRDYAGMRETVGIMPRIHPEERKALLFGIDQKEKKAETETLVARAYSAKGPEIQGLREQIKVSDIDEPEMIQILDRLDTNEKRDLNEHLREVTEKTGSTIFTEEDLQAHKPDFGLGEDWDRYVEVWRKRNAETNPMELSTITWMVNRLWTDFAKEGGLKDDQVEFERRRQEILRISAPYELRKDAKSQMAKVGRATWEAMQSSLEGLEKAHLKRLQLEAAEAIDNEIEDDNERAYQEHLFHTELPGLRAQFPDKNGPELWRQFRTNQSRRAMLIRNPEGVIEQRDEMIRTLQGFGVLPPKGSKPETRNFLE